MGSTIRVYERHVGVHLVGPPGMSRHRFYLENQLQAGVGLGRDSVSAVGDGELVRLRIALASWPYSSSSSSSSPSSSSWRPGDPDSGDGRRSGGGDFHGGDGDADMPAAAEDSVVRASGHQPVSEPREKEHGRLVLRTFRRLQPVS